MATSRTPTLNLILQDDNEFISVEKIAENFSKIDEAIAEDRTAIGGFEGGEIVQAATLETVQTADGMLTRWGKVKKAITDLIAHLGAGGNVHPAVTESTAGFMTAADKVKLDGIEDGATRGGTGTTFPLTKRGRTQTTIAANATQKTYTINYSGYDSIPIAFVQTDTDGITAKVTSISKTSCTFTFSRESTGSQITVDFCYLVMSVGNN